MIKNEHTASNEAIYEVCNDLRNNKELGSLFQFWVWQAEEEIQSEFDFVYGMTNKRIDINFNRIRDLAINIVKRIAQEQGSDEHEDK